MDRADPASLITTGLGVNTWIELTRQAWWQQGLVSIHGSSWPGKLDNSGAWCLYATYPELTMGGSTCSGIPNSAVITPLQSICNHSQEWELLSWFIPFRYFPNFSTSPEYMLAIEYHVYIWQVSPQLSCGDTCQISMRFQECNTYFCEIEYLAYGEILDERRFSKHGEISSTQVSDSHLSPPGALQSRRASLQRT